MNLAGMVARAMQSRNSKLILCPFCFFNKIDCPFCLQNCFFLLAAHFAQILLSKFCQGLIGSRPDPTPSAEGPRGGVWVVSRATRQTRVWARYKLQARRGALRKRVWFTRLLIRMAAGALKILLLLAAFCAGKSL